MHSEPLRDLSACQLSGGQVAKKGLACNEAFRIEGKERRATAKMTRRTACRIE